MKKNLLSALFTLAIVVSVFGTYYLHRANYFVKNNQSPENNFRETSEPSEKPNADSPEEAYKWRALAWRDENGQIPPNALSEAIRQRDVYLQQQTRQTTPEEDARLNWVSKGPQNVGGRTRSIIIHPNDPNIIWAGSVSGGIWKSTNGGQTWFAMNGNLQNYAISSMAIDPNNPNILYAGTGEGFFNSDGLQGGGMFKTTDGGMTWTLVPGTDPQPPYYYDWSRIDRISIAHDDSNKILVATGTGIMRTTNGGTTWANVFNKKSLYVAFDPADSSKAIAENNVDSVS
ncbi:MAG: WD40/YVTN/BNR-like repeat-containing protein [Pyrinomonadaceae bacterium]